MENVSWLAFAPLAVLALVVATVRTGPRAGAATLREDILVAVLVLGVSLALGTEGLSQLRAISYAGVLGFWLLAIAIAAVTLAWRWRRVGPPAPLRVAAPGVVDGTLVAGIVAIALALLVVAWLAPPQSSDSLGYHMSRVMHWIQNRSIAHFPTPDAPQNFEPPFAEFVRLHLQLLSGGDRAGNLLQWFAAMGALAGASLLARDLGGGRRAQIFAAVFVITLPIGITQASSGKNGWVEAMWLLSLAHFSGLSGRSGDDAPRRSDLFAAAAALGLELTTKITSWLFAAPMVLLAIVRMLRMPREARRQLVVPGISGMLIVCTLAAPYLARNVSVYGHPLADPVFQSKSGLEELTPAIVVSNVVRNALFQFGTGSAAVNDALMDSVLRFHEIIGVDPFDPRISQFGRFRISPPTRIEELAYSPLHILLLVGAGFAILGSRVRNGPAAAMLAAIGAAYVLFCATVKFQAPGCRLLMPLLVLAAPLVAVSVTGVLPGRAIPILASILFVACLPYVAATEARPLSFEPGEGILATPRADLYFARVPGRRVVYEEIARAVRESGARNVGVVFTSSGQPEYLLWMLLKRADPSVRIENVMVQDASRALASRGPFRDFRPDLVVVVGWDRHFGREIVAAGTKLAFVRGSGSTAFYASAAGPAGAGGD